MLSHSLAIAIALFFVLSSRAFAQEAQDLGFEKGPAGEPPAGWRVPSDGWKAVIFDDSGDGGARSVKLFVPDKSTAPFGNVMRSVPADDFAGKHVTLTAKMLVIGSGRGQMWLRVDRSNGLMGAFDNMGDRPITSEFGREWRDAKIDVDVESDAARLNYGFMSIDGTASVLIREVKLKVSAEKANIQAPSPPRALSSRGLENLVAATKLLAYVRFFHASDQAVGMPSWDHFAVDLMEHAEPATDAADLAHRLVEEIAAIAPTVDIWAGAPEQAPARRPSPEGANHVVYWKHHGAGSIAKSNPMNIYTSTVERGDLATAASLVAVKRLGEGISCRIPITVFADDQGTLPRGITPDAWTLDVNRPKLVAANRSTRLADVALAWGVFEHFYPYFDVVKTDWEAALPSALSKAAQDDEISFGFTLSEMVAKLHDGHGHVSHGMSRMTMLPLAVEWAGKDLVVVGKHAGVPSEISIGDVIVSIDGRPIEDCYNAVSKWISAATDGWRRYESQWELVSDLETKDPARIVVRKVDASTATVDLARVAEATENSATSKRPENGAELRPGVVYFDLNGTNADALEKVMPKLAAARAIIFDMRGYPGRAAMELMKHLIDVPATSAHWCVPEIIRPDREDIEWQESGRWKLEPESPRLTAQIAFLTDGRAISYAESIMGIVENYKMGEIVGSTTAGTNGNVNPFKLPGGYNVAWTGMKVLKHDGSQHHGVGIAPTVPVIPTAKGIADGRDEVLERAVELMQARMIGPMPAPK